MQPPFEEALETLFDQYADTNVNDLISALELKLHALHERKAQEDVEGTDGLDV